MAHVFEKKWRSNDVRVQGNVDFKGLLLSDKVLKGLRKAGFKKPSPIQLEAIPTARFGKDLMVQAKSGTGKTLVFVITALEMLKPKLYRPQILIIVPTREIASQVCSVFKAVGSGFHKLACNCFIGGLPIHQDQEIAVSTQIVVGTPGRLRQLINQKSLPTNSIRLLVFDEADELLRSVSFKDDLEDIFTKLPDDKQVIATSATFTSKVKKVMTQYLCDPAFIRLNAKHLALLGMIHYAVIVEFCPLVIITYRNKLAVLERILKTVKFAQCLLFCNGVQRVNYLYDDVKKLGFSVAYMSSAKDQMERLKAIERLKRFKCKVLVSSDLTARGIDAENVDLVINFDLPKTTEVYMHRVGRAGRFGSIGVAISIIDDTELRNLQSIQKEGSLKTFKLPDPIPKDLILNPPEAEFLYEESEVVEENGSKAKKRSRAKKSNIIRLKEHELNDSDANNGLEEESDVEDTEVEADSETCENDSSELVANDLKGDQNDITSLGSEKNKIAKSKIKKNKTSNPTKQSCEKNLQNGYSGDDGIKLDENKHANLLNDIDQNESVINGSAEMEDKKGEQNEIAFSKCEKSKIVVHSTKQPTDNFQNEYTSDEDAKIDTNKSSDLLNHVDQNDIINIKPIKIISACDIYEKTDFCDKNALEKSDTTKDDIPSNALLNYQLSCNLPETPEQKEIKQVLELNSVDNLPEISQSEVVKNMKDDVNCEQESVKSCDELRNIIKAFVDTYEKESDKKLKFIKPEDTLDQDSQMMENCDKKCVTSDVINNLQLQKHAFFYKTFKMFSENNFGSSDVSKIEKEEIGRSNDHNSSSDLITEEVKTVHEELAKESQFESKELSPKELGFENTSLVSKENVTVDTKLAETSQLGNKNFPGKPSFESTPQTNNKNKQTTAKMPVRDSGKPFARNKVSHYFEEISDDYFDSEVDSSSEEYSEVPQQDSSSTSKSQSSQSDSESASSSSNFSSISSSNDSDEDSDSETDSSGISSSDDTSSLTEDGESTYRHNCSRTGRQNPSLVSGSFRGRKIKNQPYHGTYYQEHNCVCAARERMSQPRRNQCSQFPSSSDSACLRNIQNIPYHCNSSSFNHLENSYPNEISSSRNRFQNVTQDVHPRCHRFRNSYSGASRERRGQNTVEHPMHQSSSGHQHSMNSYDCYMPTQHRCHPNTPEYPCSHPQLCEMFYKTFYNQWLFIQNAQRGHMPF